MTGMACSITASALILRVASYPSRIGSWMSHEDEVRPVRRRCGKSCLAIHGFDHFEIRAREQIPQDLPVIFLILDHQDALAHDGPACVSTRTGSVK